MGAVFAAAAQAPLTAIASVVEMTGNFALTLPIMLAVGIAAGVSKRLTYGTIYTTKLLRRGTDIERPRPASLLQALTVADTMQPLLAGILQPGPAHPDGEGGTREMADPVTSDGEWTRPLGTLVETRDVQALFADESLEHALRQLVLYGPDGLPVLARRVATYARDATQANMSAEWASADPAAATRVPPTPLAGYQVAEIAVTDASAVRDRRIAAIEWPPGSAPVAVIRQRRTRPPRPDTVLHAGDHLILLVPDHRPTPRDPQPFDGSPADTTQPA
jgi:CIC family chloride channel protein